MLNLWCLSLMASVSSLIPQGGAVDGLAQSEFADACLPVSRGIPWSAFFQWIHQANYTPTITILIYLYKSLKFRLKKQVRKATFSAMSHHFFVWQIPEIDILDLVIFPYHTICGGGSCCISPTWGWRLLVFGYPNWQWRAQLANWKITMFNRYSIGQ